VADLPLLGSDAAVYSSGSGKLYAVASQDMNSMYLATLEALKQLELEVTEKAKGTITDTTANVYKDFSFCSAVL